MVYTDNVPTAPTSPSLFQPTSMVSLGVSCDQITKEGTFGSNLKIFPLRNLAQAIRGPLEYYLLQN